MPMGKKDKLAVKQIIFYTAIMIMVSVIPVLGFTGNLQIHWSTAVLVFILGFVMLYYAFRLYKEQNDKQARNLMLASVLYITMIQIISVSYTHLTLPTTPYV